MTQTDTFGLPAAADGSLDSQVKIDISHLFRYVLTTTPNFETDQTWTISIYPNTLNNKCNLFLFISIPVMLS